MDGKENIVIVSAPWWNFFDNLFIFFITLQQNFVYDCIKALSNDFCREMT